MALSRSRVRLPLAPPIFERRNPVLRLIYLALAASAIIAAIFGSLLLPHMPGKFFAPFALNIVANLSFAVGAYSRAMVLHGARHGIPLPGWNKAAQQGIGFALVAMISSAIAFAASLLHRPLGP